MEAGMRCCLAILTVVAALAAPAAAVADKRVALVIGNAAYQNSTALKTPTSDAADMAAALHRLSFEVIDGTDLDKRAMERTMRQFTQRLTRADLALFYFAGHALQSGGQNYLMPVDARLRSEGDADFEALPLSLVLRQMQREAKTSIVLIDASRDNPLARSLARSLGTRGNQIGHGLAEVRVELGTLIGLSTQPGNIAAEGEGRNSPYAQALVRQLEVPGKDVSGVLVAVRNDVLQATGGKQVPWEASGLIETIYLRDGTPAPPPTAARPADPSEMPPDYDKEMEIAFFNAIKTSTSPAVFAAYLDRFPRGTFAPLARVMMEALKRQNGAMPAITAAREPTPVPSAALPTTSPQALARALQSELKRVGCDPGSLDGQWGDHSREALDKFARASKLALATSEPSEAALAGVAAQSGRICPLECAKDEREINGVCVARSRAGPGTGARRRPKGNTERQTTSPFQVCVGSRALGLCTN